VVELLDRPDQAEVSLLDQVGEGEAEVPVVLRDRDDELQIVLDEAVLHVGHAVVRVIDRPSPLQQFGFRKLCLRLEILQPAASGACSAHLSREPQNLLLQLDEHRQRELCRVHVPHDPLVDPLEFGRAPALADLLALREQVAQAFHGALHPRGDFAGLLVADRFRELRARVRERAKVVPAIDHVPGGTRDHIEGRAQLAGGLFEILREMHFFFAAQRARAADLLEIGLQGPPLAAGVESAARERNARRAGLSSGSPSSGCFEPIVELHLSTSPFPRYASKLSDTVRRAPVSTKIFVGAILPTRPAIVSLDPHRWALAEATPLWERWGRSARRRWTAVCSEGHRTAR
jgi:hypothetical protein